jgi:hypothetical protein
MMIFTSDSVEVDIEPAFGLANATLLKAAPVCSC